MRFLHQHCPHQRSWHNGIAGGSTEQSRAGGREEPRQRPGQRHLLCDVGDFGSRRQAAKLGLGRSKMLCLGVHIVVKPCKDNSAFISKGFKGV